MFLSSFTCISLEAQRKNQHIQYTFIYPFVPIVVEPSVQQCSSKQPKSIEIVGTQKTIDHAKRLFGILLLYF